MICDPFPPFLSPDYRVKFATETWEQRGAAALRRAVFCTEQGIFETDDRDAIDDVAIPIVALSSLGIVADTVVGTVRIHQPEPGIWWGSRLAVAQDYRKVGALGAALIKLAVGSAHARGCREFYAYVQSRNALLFQRLHWQTLATLDLHGRPHHHMRADLDHYPPIQDAETGFTAFLKRAA
jgi:putative N-acetyltransferase (TIGR04045 family)